MKKTWGMAVLGFCLSMTVARAQNTQDWTLDVHLLTSIPAGRPDVGAGAGWSGGRWRPMIARCLAGGTAGRRLRRLHPSEFG